ncbi:MAG: HAD family phosphatase, partial [Lachnospiraceae bacterium]
AKISGENVEHAKAGPGYLPDSGESTEHDPADCLVVEDPTNGGKAAKAAGMPCVWFHNPDSGEQDIPQAVLELSSWEDKSGVEQMLKLLKEQKTR